MKHQFKPTFFLLFVFHLLLIFNVNGQTSKEDLPVIFAKIKAVPSSYVNFKEGHISKNRGEIDSNYQKILIQDSLAILFLIKELTDTAETKIFSACSNSFLKKGDVALFILHNIDHVIIEYSRDCEWDVIGDCGLFPQGFFEYFQKDREKFQNMCRQTVSAFYPTLQK